MRRLYQCISNAPFSRWTNGPETWVIGTRRNSLIDHHYLFLNPGTHPTSERLVQLLPNYIAKGLVWNSTMHMQFHSSPDSCKTISWWSIYVYVIRTYTPNWHLVGHVAAEKQARDNNNTHSKSGKCYHSHLQSRYVGVCLMSRVGYSLVKLLSRSMAAKNKIHKSVTTDQGRGNRLLRRMNMLHGAEQEGKW